ncbi:YolD-like family protein [Bacillus idriensis]|uniref:YolD-like family protein n=1 Tax=Metabacillus idriensis TaxID=324768 RepID=A0A6I2MAB4_9BACI|nr:YolD-like family protein [Metabacillus idriensis]MRX54719.1 YolD-like family protein [Metabacillus idriensis]
MIRDRGTIKWTAMMLPEHVKWLREFDEEDGRSDKPEIDDDVVAEIEARIFCAMEAGEALTFNVWQNGWRKTIVAEVHFVDPVTRELRMINADGMAVRVNFEDIIGIM